MTEPLLFDVGLPPMRLEGGAALVRQVARVWWWGPPSDLPALAALDRVTDPASRVVRRPPGDRGGPSPALNAGAPTVLILHALTGHAAAGGPEGWWAPVIGQGQPLDPSQGRLLSIGLLGGCYGSSGPADADFPRVGGEPAAVTTWDQARAIWLALDRLGVERLELVTGGSLGAMVALCLAALAPDRVGRLALFGGCATASPWIVGFNHVAGGVVRALRDRGDPERGLELARQLAMLTYRAEAGLEDRQPRRREGWSPDQVYPVGSWLDHHGVRLRDRFDADAYLCLLGAMSHHDLARRPPDPEPAERWRPGVGDPATWVRASTLAVGIDTDNLYLPAHMDRLAAELRARGVVAESATLRSRHGHDAFLIEWPQVRDLLARARSLPPAWSAAETE